MHHTVERSLAALLIIAVTVYTRFVITRRRRMEQEIQDKNEQLDAQNEELRASNEKLRATEEELRASNEELREAQEKLIRSERLAAIGQLAGGVGHELRNPLGAIKNAVYYVRGKVAKSELGQKEPRVMEFLDIVDDDLRSIRLTLGAILEDAGHNVVTVENGYEAIEMARKTHFDVIFMDIKMTGINGVQTFREVKRIDPKAAVIMMTGYSVEDSVRKAISEGAYICIYKPFDMEKVIGLVKEICGKKKT